MSIECIVETIVFYVIFRPILYIQFHIVATYNYCSSEEFMYVIFYYINIFLLCNEVYIKIKILC